MPGRSINVRVRDRGSVGVHNLDVDRLVDNVAAGPSGLTREPLDFAANFIQLYFAAPGQIGLVGHDRKRVADACVALDAQSARPSRARILAPREVDPMEHSRSVWLTYSGRIRS